jgi:hypothetical protein
LFNASCIEKKDAAAQVAYLALAIAAKMDEERIFSTSI